MAAKICHRRFEGVARPYRVSPRRHRQRQYSEGLRPVARLVLRLPRRRRQGARRDIGPLDLRDYLETAKANGLSTATPQQHMAAIRVLFDHLVRGGVVEHNPAPSVKAPRQKLGKGETPVLTAEEADDLLRSIDTGTVVGLRDRALIGVMVFTFARISAACGMNAGPLPSRARTSRDHCSHSK